MTDRIDRYNSNLIRQWKGQLLDGGPGLFRRECDQHHRQLEQQETEPYEQIGRLKMELKWLKKVARFG